MWRILLSFYLIFAFLSLIVISIALPRIAKLDKNKPLYLYIGFYVINSVILNLWINFNPLKTILINIVLLLSSHFVGSKFRLMGLTGQISSGKSTVSKYLKSKYNAVVIEVDEINKEVLNREEVKKEIRKKFGDEVFTEENQLDKLKLRKIIFSDQNKKRQLESITHFKVFILLLMRILKEKILYRTQLLVIENALLLRFKLLRYLCFPIVSTCTTKKAEIIGRVMDRDKCDRETAEKILQNQMTQEEFMNLSDYIIFNDSSLDDLKLEVDKFMSQLNK